MTSALPDPCSTALPPFAPAARRTLGVHGVEVELVLLPARARRPGQADGSRPPFGADAAARILAAEALQRAGGLAVTPNRYPFAARQLILWSERPGREHPQDLLAAAFAWADAHDGAVLLNTVGAAASIPQAHAHLTPERQPFLPALPERPYAAAWLPAIPAVRYVTKALPFCVLGVRGEPGARAAAVQALNQCRLTAAVNLVAQDGTAWLYPRAVEVPSPHFPHALGAAELWGRWVFLSPEPFAAATGPALEQALRLAGCAPLPS